MAQVVESFPQLKEGKDLKLFSLHGQYHIHELVITMYPLHKHATIVVNAIFLRQNPSDD